MKLLPARRTTRTLLALALTLTGLGVIGWRPALRSLGAMLTVADSMQPANLAVTTTETGVPGLLELADLFSSRVVTRVGVLWPRPTLAHRELARREVRLEGVADVLTKLGVPSDAIVLIPAGEGGTTEGTAALAEWCRANNIDRLLVVTSANHSRRMQRALRRAFKAGGTTVLVHTPQFDPFRPLDWWEDRATLRTGLIELEKLLLDYLRHPLG